MFTDAPDVLLVDGAHVHQAASRVVHNEVDDRFGRRFWQHLIDDFVPLPEREPPLVEHDVAQRQRCQPAAFEPHFSNVNVSTRKVN